jgi:chromosome segregation ATPase
MRPNETADIRKALDRLQQTFEVLSDRYRDLRRERKQLRERIEEMQREREIADASTAAQLELVAGDRRRAGEMEERAGAAEQRSEVLALRIAELEGVVAEREAIIAEQAETINAARAELDQRRHHEEESWTNEEQLRKEVGSLRQQIAQMQAEAEAQQERIGQIVPMEEGHVSLPAADLTAMRREAEELRAMIARLQEERASLEGKHLQAIGKLDAATRAEAMARTEVARLEGEKETLVESLASLRAGREEYEARMRELEGERGRSESSAAELDAARDELVGLRDLHARTTQEIEVISGQLAEARALLDSREADLRALHASMQENETRHATLLAAAEERLAAADLERERLERAVVELKSEAESARATVGSLTERLQQAESSDDERLHAQRARMDEMAADMSEALDMAARKEIEAVEATQELERLRARVAELSDELDRLRALGAGIDGPENGATQSSLPFDDEDRARLTEQIDSAIRLIDRHLASGEERSA